MNPSVSVIVITYERAEFLRECLRHLGEQSAPADQIIVVDASIGNESAEVTFAWPHVEYVANPTGAGNMTDSRNVGLRFARGEIIAFLDDDAYADPGYLHALREAYSDPSVGLACARTLNGQEGEERGAEPVGRLLPTGLLTENFAAALPETVDIDHGVGATMSFRRSTLAALGGFREGYGGTSLREETDAFLRAKALGIRSVYVSDAIAHHVGAPLPSGRRFDLRYEYWASRNHALLLIYNFGIGSPMLRRYAMRTAAGRDHTRRSAAGRLVRTSLGIVGVFHGVVLAACNQRGRALPVIRDDPVGRDISRRLSEPASSR